MKSKRLNRLFPGWLGLALLIPQALYADVAPLVPGLPLSEQGAVLFAGVSVVTSLGALFFLFKMNGVGFSAFGMGTIGSIISYLFGIPLILLIFFISLMFGILSLIFYGAILGVALLVLWARSKPQITFPGNESEAPDPWVLKVFILHLLIFFCALLFIQCLETINSERHPRIRGIFGIPPEKLKSAPTK